MFFAGDRVAMQDDGFEHAPRGTLWNVLAIKSGQATGEQLIQINRFRPRWYSASRFVLAEATLATK